MITLSIRCQARNKSRFALPFRTVSGYHRAEDIKLGVVFPRVYEPYGNGGGEGIKSIERI